MSSTVPPARAERALTQELFQKHERTIFEHTDRLFAGLLAVEWLAGIAAAYWITPLTWSGGTSRAHFHVSVAIYFGGLITLFPIALALLRPGRTYTRHVIALAQVAWSSLLIHFTGGRIETHFHVFASLVFLSFYRDWRVLLPATAFVAIDHFLRGVYWPESVFGISTASHWRWLEHAGWVVFENVFLFSACLRGKQEMWSIAERTAALHTSETRYRAIVARAEGIFLIEVGTGRLVECNAAFHNLLGYSADEVTARTIYDFDAAPREDVDNALRSFVQHKRPLDVERQYRRKDGSVIEVTLSLSALVSGAGDTICGTIRDVTDHRRAEQALIESEARKAAIVEAAFDSVITIDAREQIIEFNPTAEQTFHCARVDAIGKRFSDLVVPEATRARYQREFANAVATGASTLIGTRFEATAVRAGDAEFPAEFAIARIVSSGEPIFICFVRDLTERKQAEEVLRQTEAQLRQSHKMDAVGQLAGGVAHDFNNLLTAILGYTEVVVEELGPDHELSADAEQIARAGQTAASVTRQLLAFSRRQVLQPTVLDLNDTVSNVEKMLRRLIGEHIDLVLTLAPELQKVEADAGQIEQVLINLAVNARDAMRDGGRLTLETRNIDVRGRGEEGAPSGSCVMILVTDTGCGMDAALQARIFEPFFTTKEQGKGTGLGLSTVYGIVKQSGGSIAVDSAPGCGTTFRILLPSLAAPARTAHTSGATSLDAPLATETVLLVEDEAGVRSLSRRALQRAGFKVLEAAHPDEALRVASAHKGPIDLILSDVVLPRMSGRVLAERLVGAHPAAKVLFMSGYPDDALAPHGVAIGGELAFLQKPFTPRVLLQKVRDVLASGHSGLPLTKVS